jgi:bleomycin hydrolase
VLKQLEGSYTGTPTEKAVRNAISHVGIQQMAVNSENVGLKDKKFNVEVKNTGISNQKNSGRCWLFTGLNILRGRAMKKLGNKNFFLSQVHLFFYDQLEKSNLFLQGIIDTRKQPIDSEMVRWLFRNPLSDGGTYTGVADLAMKYGVVPAEVMPETYVSNSTSEFCGHLKRKLREFGITLREKSEAGMSEKELQALKQIFIVNKRNYLQNDATSGWKSYLVGQLKNFESLEDLENYEAVLSDITTEDIRQAFNTFIDLDNQIILSIGEFNPCAN